MGSSIKVATMRDDERYVHELCLGAADLEARYAAREVRCGGGCCGGRGRHVLCDMGGIGSRCCCIGMLCARY